METEYLIISFIIGVLVGVRVGMKIMYHDIMTDERWTYTKKSNT